MKWQAPLENSENREGGGAVEETILKGYEKTMKEISLEIMELFKRKNLSVALMDDVLEYTKNNIHRNAHL